MRMPHGTYALREWPTYSTALDKVFCFGCTLFGTTACKSASFVENRTQNWANLPQIIKTHEVSAEHVESEISRSIFTSSLERVDYQLGSARSAIVNCHREIVKVIFDITYYLAKLNLAFRGKKENFCEGGSGNFIDFSRLSSSFGKLYDGFKEKRSSIVSL